MSKPLVVSIPHNLGRAEALRRIRTGIERSKSQFASYGSVDREVWTGDRLDFTVSALKQTLSGAIDVRDSDVVLTMELPWVLTMLAEKAKTFISRQGTKMLEHKPG